MILNPYVLNNKASKHAKWKKKNRNERRNKSTITIGGCNIPISVIKRTDGQNITKDTEDLNDTMDHLDRTLPATVSEHILLKTHRNSPGWTIQWVKKTNLNRFKMTEIITYILLA